MAEPDSPTFVPDGYQPLHRLGAGQTSQVYLARHDRFGQVALKIPRESLAHRPVLRRMFENEVQITLKLEHPHVVRAFAGYPTGPKAFLALEYCAGGTLDQLLLERGRMELERSLRLILGVAEGLRYTHDARVLHRDVKPANVFLDEQGQAKLGDFGTGTFLAEDSDERVGTAFYMAPEIFEGSTSTQRSDVYSLGVLGYEVVTGVRPFLGDSYDALMLAHMSGVPRDPRRYRDDLGAGTAKVLLKAMSRDPDKRYPSVAAFLEALRRESGLEGPAAQAAAGSDAPAVGRRGRSRGSETAESGEAPTPSEEEASNDREARRRGLLARLFGFGKDR